jgi:uncharacterized membrane protein required for colicin V production
MSFTLLLDIVTLVILAVFVLIGIKQGFVRAICSFLAIFIALGGGILMARFLAPGLTHFLAPRLVPAITEWIDTDHAELTTKPAAKPDTEPAGDHAGTGGTGDEEPDAALQTAESEQAPTQRQTASVAPVAALTAARNAEAKDAKEAETPEITQKAAAPGILSNLHKPTWNRLLEQTFSLITAEDEGHTAASTPAGQFAESILRVLVTAALFVVGFLVVLILWIVLSHVFALAAKLPVLNFANKTVGGIFGFLKGVIFLLFLRWLLCDQLAVIDPLVAAHTWVFRWLQNLLALIMPLAQEWVKLKL